MKLGCDFMAVTRFPVHQSHQPTPNIMTNSIMQVPIWFRCCERTPPGAPNFGAPPDVDSVMRAVMERWVTARSIRSVHRFGGSGSMTFLKAKLLISYVLSPFNIIQ